MDVMGILLQSAFITTKLSKYAIILMPALEKLSSTDMPV